MLKLAHETLVHVLFPPNSTDLHCVGFAVPARILALSQSQFKREGELKAAQFYILLWKIKVKTEQYNSSDKKYPIKRPSGHKLSRISPSKVVLN